jgi:topoisomerase IA-like protein
MAKYSKKAQDTVEDAMHRMKKGDLESGRSGKKVTNPKQAVAIGLSEAREKGAKVPKKAAKKSAAKKSPKKAAAKKSAPKKAASKKSATKKSASKKSASK